MFEGKDGENLEKSYDFVASYRLQKQYARWKFHLSFGPDYLPASSACPMSLVITFTTPLNEGSCKDWLGKTGLCDML